MKIRIVTITFSLAALILPYNLIMADGAERSLDLGLNATQSSYSNSWTGGEAGNVTWVANANGIFTEPLSSTITLKNTIKLAFGQTISQDKDDKTWSKPVKSTDKIDLESVGLFDIKAYVEPYAAFRFESQFLDASVDSIKRYINPIVMTESGGFARKLYKKDKNDIITRLGGAIKENIKKVIIDTAAAKTETESSVDGGLESVTDVKLALSDKLGYLGKLTLYKALFFSKKEDFKGTEEEDYWKAIDINWENSITASISKYVQVQFYFQLLYDKQISKRGRLKETLSLGLTYKML